VDQAVSITPERESVTTVAPKTQTDLREYAKRLHYCVIAIHSSLALQQKLSGIAEATQDSSIIVSSHHRNIHTLYDIPALSQSQCA
jgi:hypothetical protein